MAQMNLSTETKLMDQKKRLVIANGEGEGVHRNKTHGPEEKTFDYHWGGGGSRMDWESGVNRCKLLYLEQISNEILLYSPGNYI